MKKLAWLSLGLVLGQFAYADPIESGISFTSGDWEIICDNTRTCRAAGYQNEDNGTQQPVSVLLTRAAGRNQAVVGQIRLGATDTDPTDTEVQMKINGQNFGKVSISKDGDFIGHLSSAQVEGILSSVKKTSPIDLIGKQQKWRISDKGAAAVLLKMDDVQGRINTTGAIVKKGTLTEANVLPALPKPLITAVKVKSSPVSWNPTQRSQLRAALKSTFKSDDDACSMLTDPQEGSSEISITRLNDQKLLASALCWRAAYNEGYGYWVIDAKAPYHPVLVTTDASDYQEGKITSVQKGRGVGDCLSSESWAWDGNHFIHTGASTTGECKAVAAGGTWDLPTFVSTVR
ncbi:DUF1176 domain-containing protein [Aquirhabdus sp.]|uniref:DUF1176 domain-containing protein n=1 Tax=Aquirhabdus sp. TaxID=2824160 RepID=UPI00396D03AF